MPAGAHYITTNDTTRVPGRVVILDTDTSAVRDGGTRTHMWRLGVALFAHRTKTDRWITEVRQFEQPWQFWGALADFCRTKRRTVLYAHNLAIHLRVADGLAEMASLGFDLEDIRLSRYGTWCRWRHGETSVIAADTASIWPVSLGILGRKLGMERNAISQTSTQSTMWEERERSVSTLWYGVQQYLDWLRDADMGCWQATGAGQSWSTWRHKFYTHRVLVSDDLGSRTFEKRAMWAGRAEAWSYGQDLTATIYDYDWTCAYPHLAARYDVPVKQLGSTGPISLDSALHMAQTRAVLALCTVTTDLPLVPTAHDRRILWPVGTFRTVLWDPELRLLAEGGANVRIHRTYLYRREPALRDWAEWMLSEITDTSGEVPGWRKIALKQQSRTLIGRFAMQYRAWEPIGLVTSKDVRIIAGHDREADADFTFLHVGEKLFELSDVSASNNYAPMITGYIMAHARVQLWNAARDIGFDHVVYVDTDSLLVTLAGHRVAGELVKAGDYPGLRLKRRFRGWEIAGPRQLILGGEPRISGLPRGAERTGDASWRAETWQGWRAAIDRGAGDQLRVTSRTFRIRGVDRRREHSSDGRTRPFALTLDTQDAPGIHEA